MKFFWYEPSRLVLVLLCSLTRLYQKNLVKILSVKKMNDLSLSRTVLQVHTTISDRSAFKGQSIWSECPMRTTQVVWNLLTGRLRSCLLEHAVELRRVLGLPNADNGDKRVGSFHGIVLWQHENQRAHVITNEIHGIYDIVASRSIWISCTTVHIENNTYSLVHNVRLCSYSTGEAMFPRMYAQMRSCQSL